VLVLDDIGTKVERTKVPLRPTYRIETSPRNEQWGFVLKEPETSATKATRLLEAAKAYGATDKGGVGIVRYARLPCGVNGKPDYGLPPPAVRLLEWNSTRRYTPEEIAQSLGTELTSRSGRPLSDMPPLPPTEDTLVPVLKIARLLKHDAAPNERGYITIRCPWAKQHSDGKDEAGYKPGGLFACFHDHCATRSVDDLLKWLRGQGYGDEVEAAIDTMPGPRGGLLRALRRYVYVRDIDRFLDLEQPARFLTVDSLDRFEVANMPGHKPSKNLLENPGLRKPLIALYLPGKRALFEYREGGRPILAAKTWRVGPIASAPKDIPDKILDAAMQPYLDHLHWLFPDAEERTIVLDWITHIVQRRGVRINWILVALAQAQGAGRDTLLKPIRNILGVRNVRTINAETLFEPFNEWELAELVCFSEADTTDHSRWAVYRALKSKVVTPPDSMQVNIKFVRATEQPKVANYVMFTNDPGAIAFDKTDRRVCVVETPHSFDTILEYGATGVFRELHALFDDPKWMARFHRWLLRRAISPDFDASGRAPRTAAWRRMFQASRSALEVFVEEAIEERRPQVFQQDLVKLTRLLEVVRRQPELNYTTLNALAAALRRCGAEPWPDFQDGRRKWVRGMWALRDAARYAAMSTGAKRDEWARL
jgi:hypothetical protein